jgi:hypothetical protein
MLQAARAATERQVPLEREGACFYFSRKWRGLLDSDGFREIAGLVDVATAAHRDVIGEKLERDDFEQGRENFRSWRQLDEVVGNFLGEMIAYGADGDDDTVASFDF